MKKLMTAMAICAAASYTLAAGSVTSANVVGYKGNVSAFANNFTMIGIPFSPVGGGATPIAQLFTDNTVFTAGDTLLNSDNILVWNGSSYTYYFYSSDAGSPGAWSAGTDGFEETADTIPVGGAAWLRRRGTALSSLTIAGEVIKTNVSVSANANTFTMVGNPFSAALSISSITASSLTAGDTLLNSDNILVWNGSSYVYYFYSSDAGAPGAWSAGTDGFDVTSDSIPAGGAFWFRRRGGVTTLTLPVPYSL
jgi:hypothetical protein